MRRLGIVGVLVFAAAALAVSCGRKGGEAKGKVRLWHIQVSGPTKDVVERAVARVQARHPDVEIESVGYKNDAFKTKLRLAMESGDPPDVFHTWGGGGLQEWVDSERILDLTSLFPSGPAVSYNPRAVEFCLAHRPNESGEGSLHALPADITAVVFWYNREIFETQGLNTPKTWAEFKQVCRKLKAVGVTPVSLGNSQKWPGCFYFIYFATRLGGMRPFGEGKYGAPSFVAAGDRIRELVDMKVFSRGFNGVRYDDSRREFFTGGAAMTLMGSWILSHARKEAPEFLKKMDCFAFPSVEGGAGEAGGAGTVVGGMNAGSAVSSACKKSEVAVDLATELTGRQAAEEWAAAGRIPARTDVDLSGVDQATGSLIKIMNSADAIQLYYDQALPSALAQLHKETTQAIFAGTMTGAEAAKKMADAAE